MKFKINWQETVGYFTIVDASSPEEALKKFHYKGTEAGDTEEDGFREMQDNIEIDNDPV